MPWLLALVAISIGAAGIPAFAYAPPGDRTRPELTARGDTLVAPRVASVTAGLDGLETKLTDLVERGREAIVAINGRDSARLSSALQGGSTVAQSIAADSQRLHEQLAQLPISADSDRISSAMRARLEAIEAALDAVGPVEGRWTELMLQAGPAGELADLLERHDTEAFEGASHGVKAEYADALESVGRAKRTLQEVRIIREELVDELDVTTLDQWIERNAAYDDALTRLYTALNSGKDPVGAEVLEAYAQVQRAQEELPPNTDTLVVIMGEVGQGGAYQAVDALERARGTFAKALTALH